MATFNIYVKSIKLGIDTPTLSQPVETSDPCQSIFEFLVWAPIGATVNLSFVGPVNNTAYVSLNPDGLGFITLGASYSFQPNGEFRPLRIVIANTNVVETINVQVTAEQGGNTQIINVSRDSTGGTCY